MAFTPAPGLSLMLDPNMLWIEQQANWSQMSGDQPTDHYNPIWIVTVINYVDSGLGGQLSKSLICNYVLTASGH